MAAVRAFAAFAQQLHQQKQQLSTADWYNADRDSALDVATHDIAASAAASSNELSLDEAAAEAAVLWVGGGDDAAADDATGGPNDDVDMDDAAPLPAASLPATDAVAADEVVADVLQSPPAAGVGGEGQARTSGSGAIRYASAREGKCEQLLGLMGYMAVCVVSPH